MNSLMTSWLSEGRTVITTTRRLARHLAHRYALSRRESGEEVWHSPDIIPLNAWLTRSWEQSVWTGTEETRTLINAPQTQLVWQNVIRRRLGDGVLSGHSLVQPHTLANGAARSRSLLMQHEIPVVALASYPIRETQAFLRWIRDFETVCEKNGWIDIDALPAALASVFVESNEIRNCVLAGFDDLPPSLENLFSALETKGWIVDRWMPATESNEIVRTRCRDTRDEIRCAARWLRECLAKDPGARAAIVSPDLGRDYEMAWRECSGIFDPNCLLPGHSAGNSVFHIARSRNLAEIPVVDTALRILLLGGHSIEFDDVSRVLRSPNIGSLPGKLVPEQLGSEQLTPGHVSQGQSANGLLELLLRDRGDDRITLQELSLVAKNLADAADPSCNSAALEFAERLSRLLAVVEPGSSHLPGSWAEIFSQWLEIMGWPGEQGDDATVMRFLDVIGHFGSLDLVAAEMTLDQAQTALKTMLRGTAFQPQGAETRIEITTPEEAAGFEFDYLWIANLDDITWPAAQRSDPFVPASLQRQYAVVEADHALHLARANRIQERLLSSARQTVLSWPQRREDRDMRVSPLLSEFTSIEIDTLIEQPQMTPSQQIYAVAAHEYVAEKRPPGISTGTPMRGGTAVLELQSACPFRAFAELRLQARNLERPRPGLDARQRGSMVHRAMEFFWNTVGDQNTLLSLDDAQVRNRVADSVERAATKLDHGQNPLRRRLLVLEKTRISGLMLDLLELEKQRAEFRVTGRELDREVTLGNLALRVRIDRVDEIADGREVVLDYKTGRVAPGEWFQYRLPKPQLPVYSISASRQPVALSYVSMRAGDVCFKGVAAEAGLLPGIDEFKPNWKTPDECSDWSGIQDFWRTNLDALAGEFCDGRIAVDPARNACAWCHLSALCRVDELNLRESQDEQIG